MRMEVVYIISIILISAVAMYEFKMLLNQKILLGNYENIRKKLYETSMKISKMSDEEEIYTTVLETILDLIPNSSNGSVLLYNYEDEKFYFKVVKGYKRELRELTIRKEEAYLYKMNEFKKTVIVYNPNEFDRKNVGKETIEKFERINALDISCTLSAPIYIDNKFIGLINVDSNKSGHIFTERDLNLMDQIKCELELAIKNALAQNRLKYLVNYDELTGLINRRKIKIEFDKELEKIKITNKTFCLAMIDLDNFKIINDTYGHYHGDVVLKHFSSILKNSVSNTDLVARYAGDEFVILFKDHSKTNAISKMNEIKKIVLSSEVSNVKLNFSFGISEIKPKENIDFDKALEDADIKMYERKKVKAI